MSRRARVARLEDRAGVRPLGVSNSRFTSSETTKESCVTRTTSVGRVVAARRSRAATDASASTTAAPSSETPVDFTRPRLDARPHGEQDAALERDARRLAARTVRDAAARAGLERLAGERVREALGADALGRRRAARGARRARPARPRAVRSPRITCRSRAADPRVDLDVGVARRSRGGGGRRAGGRAARRRPRGRGCAARPSSSAASSASSRSVASFASRMPLDARAGAPRLPRPRRRDAESKSPIARSTSSPSASAWSSSAVGGDDARARRHARAGVGVGSLPARDDHHDLVRHAPSSAGITQIRFAGRRRFEPPSQPGCPSSPYTPGHRSPAQRARAAFRRPWPLGEMPRSRRGSRRTTDRSR